MIVALGFVALSTAFGGVIGLCWSGLVVLILRAFAVCTREEWP